MTSWRQEGRRTAETERVRIEDLAPRAEADPALQILDVREQAEWDAGHIPGSAFTPWHDIVAVPAGLDAKRPIAVLCASGQRAATAASLVQRHDAREVIHVVGGGVPAWERLGHPVEAPPATTSERSRPWS